MGQRGPKPTPTPILARRGSVLVPRRKGEISPQVKIPKCPAWVSPEARKYWKDIAGLLEAMRVLTALDQLALGLLVDAVARYVAAKKVVYAGTKEKLPTGETTFNAAGTEVKHPMFVIMQDSWAEILKACREFGLTPSSRTGVRLAPVSGKKENDAPKKSRFFEVE